MPLRGRTARLATVPPIALPVGIGDAQRLADIEKAFAAENVVIAEIGIWRNLVTRDAAVRKAHREIAVEKLAVADAVGARCAVSYIGSYAPGSDYGPSPENFTDEAFDDAVEAARYLIDTVKPRRAKFALEMEQYSLPDSVDLYVELIRAVDRPAFAAHVDPVNLVLTPAHLLRHRRALARNLREARPRGS